MISSTLLKFIIQLGLLLVQIFGVWPYRYDHKSKCFQTTKVLRCYTAIVVPFILFAYVFSISTITINRDERVHVPSSIGRSITVFLSMFIIVAYAISSVAQIVNYNSINEWFKKSRVLLKKIHSFRKGYKLPFL